MENKGHNNLSIYLSHAAVIVIIQLALIVIPVIVFLRMFPQPYSYEKCGELFGKYEREFQAVATASIGESFSYRFSSDKQIENSDLKTLVKKCGCEAIDSKDGTVYFGLRSGFRSASGILYRKPNSGKIDKSLFKTLKALEVSGWYYYEES